MNLTKSLIIGITLGLMPVLLWSWDFSRWQWWIWMVGWLTILNVWELRE